MRGKRAGATAAQKAETAAVTRIQRTWRNKRAMKILINFKKKMKEGGVFFKYSTKVGVRFRVSVRVCERSVWCTYPDPDPDPDPHPVAIHTWDICLRDIHPSGCERGASRVLR